MASEDNIASAVIDGCKVTRLPQQTFCMPLTFRFKVERIFDSYHPDPETAFNYYKHGASSKGMWPNDYDKVIDGFTIARVSNTGAPFKYKIKERNEYFHSNSHDIGVAFYLHQLRTPMAKLSTTSDFPWGGRPQGFSMGFGVNANSGTSSLGGGFGASASSGSFASTTGNYAGCFSYTKPVDPDQKNPASESNGNFAYLGEKEDKNENIEPSSTKDESE